jgi:hypothetical protein
MGSIGEFEKSKGYITTQIVMKLASLKQNIIHLFLGFSTKNRNVASALKKQHEQIKQMWKGESYPDFGIERIVRLFCALLTYLFPTLYIRWIAGKYGKWYGRKLTMDIYTIANLLLPLCALCCDWHESTFALIICSYFTAGTISYMINLVVLKPEYAEPGSYLRSIICLFINYVQIVAYFGFVYLCMGAEAFDGINNKTFDSLHAFYYSFVVSGTLGFGDITPVSTTAIWVTIIQSFLTFLFIYLVLTNFLANINKATYYRDSQKE